MSFFGKYSDSSIRMIQKSNKSTRYFPLNIFYSFVDNIPKSSIYNRKTYFFVEKKNFVDYLNNRSLNPFVDRFKSKGIYGKINGSKSRFFAIGNNASLKPFIYPDIHVVGLTGGITAGKSTACKFLKSKGISIIDADKLGHEAYLPGSDGYKQIIECFGFDEIVNAEDGTIDRAKLGAIVFNDKNKMNDLTSIVWPIVTKLAKDRIKELSLQGIRCVVVEAAILFEAGWDVDLVDEVWCLGIPEEEAIKRLIKRNALTEDQARKRILSQLDNKTRKERSLIYIDSSGEKEVTRQYLEAEYQKLKARIKEIRGFEDVFPDVL